MNELVKVTQNEKGEQLVSARELHEFLEATERFSSWFDRQLKFGFEEEIDYVGCKFFNTQANQELQDYVLKLDMAKELSMLSKSEKGKQARRYFIEVEKRYNSQVKLPSTFKEALLKLIEVEEAREILELENSKLTETVAIQKQVLLEQEPKITYVDRILADNKTTMTVTQIAKDYDLTAKDLNLILHEEGIQFKQSGMWLLYAKYAGLGYTKSITGERDGYSYITTKWTQKGRHLIHGILEKRGILALEDLL